MLEALGYAASAAKAPLEPFRFERREPRPNDVIIDIKFCGICHSDIHKVRNEWGGSTFPMVPGHEIVGFVSRVGSNAKKFKVGDRVGVGCIVDSCRVCPNCSKGLEQFCCDGGPTWSYDSFDRTDKTLTRGGYSNVITVDENYVLRIPDNLPPAAAAPLLCAGITLYSPLRHWNAGRGRNVAIVGLGGLGHMGVKLAHAMGADVTVLSHSMKKEADAKRLGADHFFATSNPETFAKLAGHFDLIINTVSADIDWNKYLGLLTVDGAMVLVGLPDKEIPLNAFSLVSGRRSLSGSLIGGIKETQEMLDFCGKNNIVSDIELIPINEVNKAYERVIKSDVRYRFVIDMASLKTAQGR